jgi:hypothetical protein
MIDATIFALLVGVVATPISWWGLTASADELH